MPVGARALRHPLRSAAAAALAARPRSRALGPRARSRSAPRADGLGVRRHRAARADPLGRALRGPRRRHRRARLAGALARQRCGERPRHGARRARDASAGDGDPREAHGAARQRRGARTHCCARSTRRRRYFVARGRRVVRPLERQRTAVRARLGGDERGEARSGDCEDGSDRRLLHLRLPSGVVFAGTLPARAAGALGLRGGSPSARPHRRQGQPAVPRRDDVRVVGQRRPRRGRADHPPRARRRDQLHRHRRRLLARDSPRRSSGRRWPAGGATT